MKGLALTGQANTQEVPVVVVGAGPAGLTAAIALARAGIETLVLERRTQASRVPRATALSTSTMELMRSWGLEERAREGDLDVELQPFMTETLATAAQGRAADAGFPTRAQSALISPTSPAGVPQDHLEPLLEAHLRSLAPARVERGAEVVGIESRRDGVELTVRDGDGGRERQVRARYLIAADGPRSPVRRALEIGSSRHEELEEHLSVLFRAPLWQLLGEHRYAIYLVATRYSAFIPSGRPDRWAFAIDWDSASRPAADVEPSEAIAWIREAAGAPDLHVRIEQIAPVPFGVDLAERFRDGDVFLIGDAAHRVTPRGATGLNTAIRDGYDIGWKLAWFLKGWADGSLLDSYEAERRPVAEHNVARSARRDGSIRSVTDELRADLGGRIAHLWLPGESGRLSTLDLLGDGLTLFTGPRGPNPQGSTAPTAANTPPVTVRRLDELSARALGIFAGGALVVRPDGVPVSLWADERPAPAERAA